MVILGSGSPRRKELLTLAGIEFTILTSDADETPTKTVPEEIVMELSDKKGQDVFSKAKEKGLLTDAENLIISADTLVFFGNDRMGKPKDKDDAVNMLKKLSGATHQVITGVHLIYEKNGKMVEKSFFEKTDVNVYPMTDAEICDYVATGEPMDKAGAYAIQGLFCKYIKGIQGEYANVVGLPIARLYKELKEIGYVR